MKRFFVIFSLVIGFYVLKTLYQAGQFKSINNHVIGEVIKIYTNVAGPEDMQVDRTTGNLFISSTNRRERGINLPQNGIYILNLENDDTPRILPTDYKGVFQPHGISLFREDSSLYLFAVNHNEVGDFVESFRYQDETLKHIKSYSYEEMCCPNDVLALAKDKFYVTNDHGTKKGLIRIVEDYLRIPYASLIYFNGNDFTKVAGPFLYANGVNMSNDGSYIYVTTTTGCSILVFNRADDGSLEEHTINDLYTGADNIDVDEDGNLWIAAHPKLLNFVITPKILLISPHLRY
jgi:Gluconolactonase